MKKQVLVVGGGASGLASAIWAAKSGARVTVIEHTERVGKKLLSTGNGRSEEHTSELQLPGSGISYESPWGVWVEGYAALVFFHGSFMQEPDGNVLLSHV